MLEGKPVKPCTTRVKEDPEPRRKTCREQGKSLAQCKANQLLKGQHSERKEGRNTEREREGREK